MSIDFQEVTVSWVSFGAPEFNFNFNLKYKLFYRDQWQFDS
jgi:hypothetical protein